MDRALLEQVKELVADLDSIHDEFESVYERKRAALIEPSPPELAVLAQTEETLAERLRGVLGRRGRLLQAAGGAGRPAGSLAELAERIDGSEGGELRGRIERARRRADQLRRENWVQWIIAQRANRHCGELIDLVAGQGRTSPVYEQGREPRDPTGGVILDASA